MTLVFSLSSYIGISSGMQRLAKLACGMTMLFALVVLLLGPTQFSVSNIANAIGLTLQNFIHMSLFTAEEWMEISGLIETAIRQVTK